MAVVMMTMCFMITSFAYETDDIRSAFYSLTRQFDGSYLSEKQEGIYTYYKYDEYVSILDVDESASGEITIPDTLGGYPVVAIAEYAFNNCRNVTGVTIPDNVFFIGDNAFGGVFGKCNSLTSVHIGKNVLLIGSHAFENCENLLNITLADTILEIGLDAFTGTAYYNNSTNWDNGAFYIGKYLVDSNDTISDDYKIKEDTLYINKNAFSGNKKIKSITIPKSVTKIGSYAFYNCSSLTAMSIDEDSCMTIIENSAFSSCVKLESLVIPDSVTEIGESVFYKCEGLKDVTISKSVTSIGKDTFYGCLSLSKVNIPEKVATIGEKAFQSCTSLESIVIPEGVTTLGDYAFQGCEKLATMVLPNGVTSIGKRTFGNCKSLSDLTVPGSISKIGEDAFAGCTNLKNTKLVISDFNDWCKKDNSFTISRFPKNWTFNINGEDTSEIVIPDEITTIASKAFFDCDNITSICIPESVTSIGDSAFSKCDSLQNVTILGNASIGTNVFSQCQALLNVTIHGNANAIGDGVFDGANVVTVYCIEGSTASIYATRNSIPFVIEAFSEETEIITGNNDNSEIIETKFAEENNINSEVESKENQITTIDAGSQNSKDASGNNNIVLIIVIVILAVIIVAGTVIIIVKNKSKK